MCEFLSGFVHDNAAKLPMAGRYLFGDLRSHSESMNLAGVVYGRSDCWREFEWTGLSADSLIVRATEEKRGKLLRSIVLADFPDRDALLIYACQHLPAGLTTLDLSSVTVPEGLKLPKNCRVIR